MDAHMMDWTTGALDLTTEPPLSGSAEQGKRWRLVCAADWMPRADHIGSMIRDPLGFYSDLLGTLADADLRIVNVECVIGSVEAPILKDGPNLRVGEETIASLTSVPFDVACLANNHIFDFGEEGLSRTRALLQESGLATVGAGLDHAEAACPFQTLVRDVPVAVINCAEGEAARSVDGGPGCYGLDLPLINEQIRELRRTGNVIIVVFHGGREHVPVPPPYVVHDLRAIADMGCDVVIAHHPHVPQGIELHHGVPIAYSLGNFAFNFLTPRFYHHVGYVLVIDFVGTRLEHVRAVPYLIEPSGLRLLSGTARTTFDQGLTRATAALDSQADIQAAWDAAVDHFVASGALWPRIRSAADAPGVGDPHLAAAAANLFFTPAHHELISRGLRRLSTGKTGSSPKWAQDLLDHYLCHSLNDLDES